jgi:hypothetical protein
MLFVSYVLGHDDRGWWWWGESRKGLDHISHIIWIDRMEKGGREES